MEKEATRGELIKQARMMKGMSQAEFGVLLSRALGRERYYSQATISDVERNKADKRLTHQVLEAIEEILEMSNPLTRAGIEAGTGWRFIRRKKKWNSSGEIFGTGDLVAVSRQVVNMGLEFVSACSSHQRNVILTKFPASLVDAFETAVRREGVFEYTGENFRGRVCSVGSKFFLPFIWVAEFLFPYPAGFLINMSSEQVELFRGEALKLPAHIWQTD